MGRRTFGELLNAAHLTLDRIWIVVLVTLMTLLFLQMHAQRQAEMRAAAGAREAAALQKVEADLEKRTRKEISTTQPTGRVRGKSTK